MRIHNIATYLWRLVDENLSTIGAILKEPKYVPF